MLSVLVPLAILIPCWIGAVWFFGSRLRRALKSGTVWLYLVGMSGWVGRRDNPSLYAVGVMQLCLSVGILILIPFVLLAIIAFVVIYHPVH
jgi:hypothetical protein